MLVRNKRTLSGILIFLLMASVIGIPVGTKVGGNKLIEEDFIC